MKHTANILWAVAALCFCAPWIAAALNIVTPSWLLATGRIAAFLFIVIGAVCYFVLRPRDELQTTRDLDAPR
jgi:hypothetical protein